MDGAILPEERFKHGKLLQLYLHEICLLMCVCACVFVCVYIPMERVKYELFNFY